MASTTSAMNAKGIATVTIVETMEAVAWMPRVIASRRPQPPVTGRTTGPGSLSETVRVARAACRCR